MYDSAFSVLSHRQHHLLILFFIGFALFFVILLFYCIEHRARDYQVWIKHVQLYESDDKTTECIIHFKLESQASFLLPYCNFKGSLLVPIILDYIHTLLITH
jgi:hypothetical protein